MDNNPWNSKDLKERLEWWAFKFCGKGNREDMASDAMTEAHQRISVLEEALEEILLELDDKDRPSWLGHGVISMIATKALAGEKKDG